MGYAFLTVSVLLTVLTYQAWTRFFARRRFKSPQEFADGPLLEWPGLVGALLPRSLRALWNRILVWLGALALGGFLHPLVIWNFWSPRSANPLLYVHYVWTLALWLSLLAIPASITVSHWQARMVAKRR